MAMSAANQTVRWFLGVCALTLSCSSGAMADPRFEALLDFNFKDGAGPVAGLVRDKTGALYGTTTAGGNTLCDDSGCGVVFKLTPPAPGKPGWTKTILYRFVGGRDGQYPFSTLVIDKSGVLYGTTSAGGDSTGCPYAADVDFYVPAGCGVVFSLTPPAAGKTAWKETVLHRFTDRSDGALPGRSLVADKSGALYGTTSAGGDSVACPPVDPADYAGNPAGCGVVFKLVPPAPGKTAWTETVLHKFTSGNDGVGPNGVIMDDKGALYGTTVSGGKRGQGVAFKLTPPIAGTGSWTETVLHTFAGAAEGTNPVGDLIMDKAGALYGVTFVDAPMDAKADPQGDGLVFRLQPPAAGKTAWTETVIHKFSGPDDGAEPAEGLVIDKNGVLYGTTTDPGIVFKLTPPASGKTAWTETVLHAFTNSRGGGDPGGPLLLGSGGALYGVAASGGLPNCGYTEGADGFSCGLVFRLVP
jgi:uncharacterized repeat protein (TIGR03803 family)